MIRHGTKPIKKDPRDYSFHRTFGAVSSPLVFPDEYTCDAGLTMPDQNADGYPYGCTGYATTDLCQDEDGIQYYAPFTYWKTCDMEGHDYTTGCQIRNSLDSARVFGVLPYGFSADTFALEHRRGAYFNVDKVDGLDWFDSLRSALYLNRAEKRAISIGTPWFPSFERPSAFGQKGIIPLESADVSKLPWHNWAIKGWITLGGTPYLVAKTWQGRGYGDNGYAYFSRAIINTLMAIPFTGAFTVRQFKPEDVQSVQSSVVATFFFYVRRLITLGEFKRALDDLLAYLRIISKKAPQPQNLAPEATPAPVTTETPPPPGKTLLRQFCEAIQGYEGKPGDLSYRLNNPGNLMYAGQPHATPHKIIGSDARVRTFAEFDTVDHGFDALEAQVRYVASGEASRKNAFSPYSLAAKRLHLADTSDLSIAQYFSVYAPTSDGNNPVRYSSTVAKDIGVPVDTPIKKLLA